MVYDITYYIGFVIQIISYYYVINVNKGVEPQFHLKEIYGQKEDYRTVFWQKKRE